MFPFAVEHLVDEAAARQLTRLFWDEMTQVWVRAWRYWGEMPEEQRARLSETPNLPPVVVWGYAQSVARELFAHRESDGIVVCTELVGTFGFYIQESLLVRFNTFDEFFMVRDRSGSSELKEQYFRQSPLRGFNNAATRITVGHVANATKTNVEAVGISCQIDDYRHFAFRVDGGDDAAIPIPAPRHPLLPQFGGSVRTASPGRPR